MGYFFDRYAKDRNFDTFLLQLRLLPLNNTEHPKIKVSCLTYQLIELPIPNLDID